MRMMTDQVGKQDQVCTEGRSFEVQQSSHGNTLQAITKVNNVRKHESTVVSVVRNNKTLLSGSLFLQKTAFKKNLEHATQPAPRSCLFVFSANEGI